MKRLRVLTACLALAACASETATDDGVEVSSDALVEGHGGIKGSVKVEANRLVIARAGNEALLASAGRVLVGGPQHSPGNPYGFLRRAVSAEIIDDGHIAITTEEASLSDAVTTGSIRAAHDIEPAALRVVPMANGNAARAGNGLDITLGERSLADLHLAFHDPTRLLPVSDFDIDRSVRLEHAQVHFEPSVELSLGIRRGQIEHLEALAKGTLEASFALTVDTKTSIDIDLNRAYRETLKGHLRTPPILVTLFETEPYVLPPQWIGFVPVVETVRFRVVLECDIDLVSQMHAEAGASLKTTATFGATYKNGAWQAVAAPTFDAKPTFAMTRSGSVGGLCGIRNEVGFFLYDLAGPTLAVTPYLQFDVGASPKGFDFTAAPGVRGTFGGRLNVFGHEFLRSELPLFDVKAPHPFTGSL